MIGYFDWLCGQVPPNKGDPAYGKNYYYLLQTLHKKKFYSLVPHDENRGEDGTVLRREYGEEVGIHQMDILMPGEASVLEVLIALARRMAMTMDGFVTVNNPSRWFWEMLQNLRLTSFDDVEIERRTDVITLVDDIVEKWLARDYDVSGIGGLFPIWNCDINQKKVEIWEQCQHYLFERYQKDILREK